MNDFTHQAGLKAPCEEFQISVRFDGGCWLVECSPSFETLSYPSGAAAEEAARRVAARFACQGQAVHVVIEDLRHALVGTQTFFAWEPSPSGSRTVQQ